MASRDPNDKYRYGDQQDWVSRRNANTSNANAEIQSLMQQIENLNAQAEQMSKALKAAIDAFEAEGKHTEEEIAAFQKIVNKRVGLIKGRKTSADKLRQAIEEERHAQGERAFQLEQEGAFIRGDVQQNARKRRTVARGLRSKFGSSKVAAAFMKQGYVQPDGQMTIAGEKKAERIREQNQFISRLVKSLATLPIFAKAGRAFQQLGMMTMMSGVSKFRQGGLGNQLLGLGQIGLGLAEYLAPAMASAFGTVMTEVVAKKISEAVTLGMIKGSAGKVGGFVGSAGKVGGFVGSAGKVGGFVGKLALPLAVLGAIGLGTKDLGKQANRYDATGQVDKARATKIAQGGLAATGFIGAIGMAIAAVIGAPLAPIIAATAAIAGVIYLIGKNVDKIFGFFATAQSWLTKLFDKINPWGKGDKHSEAPGLADKVNPYYTQQNVETSKLVQAVANKKVGKPSEFQTDRFRIIQYGTSNFETGGYTVLGSQYSKEQLEAMGAAGKGNLETLKGLNLADTFTNDARVARVGSSAILQAVQAKTGESLLITSAMASKTSKHKPGLKGHEGGQKFDFSAAGLNEAQAKAKAAKLYATGYFSHAEAEYDKQTKQWHIDARISDAAYKTLEGIQKQQQDEKIKSLQKTSPRVKEAPGTAKVADVVNGSLGLRNSLYGPALGIQ